MLGINYCQAVRPEDKTRAIYYASKPDSRIPGTEVVTFGEHTLVIIKTYFGLIIPYYQRMS